MNQGFVKVAAVTPKIKVADPEYNAKSIVEKMLEAMEQKAKIIVFPELCISGYTCQDLFLQELLLRKSFAQLSVIAEATKGWDGIVFVGLPVEKNHKLYNAVAAISGGKVLAFIPKKNLPNFAAFAEARYFAPGQDAADTILWQGENVPFGTNVLLECSSMPGLCIACEIGQDAQALTPPGVSHAEAGATVIVNPSAYGEMVGKDSLREMLVLSSSMRLISGYIFTGASEGESSQDLVFACQGMIAENGAMLAKRKSFAAGILYSDLDLERISTERRKNNMFCVAEKKDYCKVMFSLDVEETDLHRTFAPLPFVPEGEEKCAKRCRDILSIQAHGLKKRLEHVGCENVIIGVSGGLDSTLALLVTADAFDLLGLSRKGIVAVTMPCFGTTERTKSNALALAEQLGVTLKEVNIKKAVLQHFEDIGQDPEKQDVTYENAQARERTQVLMDLANQMGGLVIGTGDLSELALGWATYNGDHMSMYGVNAGVPKTLLRYLVAHYAKECGVEALAATLRDVLDTPVSPELLPPKDGEIAQKTEDIVGPYELHDFFLYYMLRVGYSPMKVFRVAVRAFDGIYEEEIIRKWIHIFYRRFFAQQFKRSCLPDGPKVGSVGVSPRGDLCMPTDASARLWLEELEEI
ncbi:MAG: NAD(+) synthase [Lachnospiraceae bacterium]|nr:NAD(+) synthase [Lachnospiraceae bacterium]